MGGNLSPLQLGYGEYKSYQGRGGGGIYRVCGLRLGPNFGVRPATGKNFYLRLTVEKMCAFTVFTQKYLRSYGYNDTIFTTEVNCTNQKTETESKIIEIQF